MNSQGAQAGLSKAAQEEFRQAPDAMLEVNTHNAVRLKEHLGQNALLPFSYQVIHHPPRS